MPKAKTNKQKLSEQEKLEQTRNFLRVYAYYSAIAFEMIVFIGGGAYLGYFLDTKYETKPLYIIICSLFGLACSFFILFRGLKNNK